MPPTNTTPLHAACRSGDVDMVWILRKKWELKKTGGLGETSSDNRVLFGGNIDD